jgi:hypothetical protein
MSTTRNTTIRTFWADVLAKASTDELVSIVETLRSRQSAGGNPADSDLLVLARSTLERRNVIVRAGSGPEVGPAQPPVGQPERTTAEGRADAFPAGRGPSLGPAPGG